MISGLEKMRILTGEKDICNFSDVECMNLLSNGECSVCLKNGNDCRTLYTHTADGSVSVARVNGDWRNVSIDHIQPLENVLREKAGELSSFLELTDLFFSYKENCGFYLNPRAEIDWNEDFFKTYEAKLLEMSDDIVRDLEKLTFDYELMERHENTRKGAGGENCSAGFGFQNSSNISDSQKSAADRNGEIESLSLDELAEVLKEKKKLALEEKIAPYIKQQKEMQEIQKRNKEYIPKYYKNSECERFVMNFHDKDFDSNIVTEQIKTNSTEDGILKIGICKDEFGKITIKTPSLFWDGYQEYLEKRGYSLYTPSGLPSTVFEYRRAVSDIKSYESLNLSDFCTKIDSIISEYDRGGIKEHLGRKKHSTWINALKRFREYLLFLAEKSSL